MSTISPASIAIAIVVGAAIATGLLLGEESPPPAAPAAPSIPAPPVLGARSTSMTAPPAQPLPPAPRPLAVVLAGVAVGSDRTPIALVSIDRGPDLLLRVGDSLGNAATVLRIDPDSMTYRHAGAEFQVSVKPGAAASTRAQTPPKPLAGLVADAPAMARAHGAEPGSGNAAFGQAVERKRMSIAAGQ